MTCKESIYKFTENNKEYAYIGECNSLFESNEIINDIIDNLGKLNEQEIIEKLRDRYEENEFIEQLEEIKKLYKKLEISPIKNEKKTLSSLILNISHDCNLRCVYCYGDGGNYGLEKKLMNRDVAKKSIDHWIDNLDKGEEKLTVGFFGGEPLMNKNVMLLSIEYINRRLKELDKKAAYIITTNGTVLDEDILNAFENNKFNVTISIDGNEKIHNRNRPFRNGEGSFSKIKENIKVLKSRNIPLNARVTLTHSNIKDFYEIVNTIWNLGIESVVYEVVTTKNEKLALNEEDLRLLEEQMRKLTNITYESVVNKGHKVIFNIFQVVRMLNSGKINPKCSFDSYKSLMVDPDGDIYRCHRMQGKEKFKVGNIYSEILFTNNKKYLNCDKCWANNLCTKCGHANYVMNNNEYQPYRLWCDCRKILYRESIKFYVKLYNEHPDIFKKIYG